MAGEKKSCDSTNAAPLYRRGPFMRDFCPPLCSTGSAFNHSTKKIFLCRCSSPQSPDRKQVHSQRQHHPSASFSLLKPQPLICRGSLVHFLRSAHPLTDFHPSTPLWPTTPIMPDMDLSASPAFAFWARLHLGRSSLLFKVWKQNNVPFRVS